MSESEEDLRWANAFERALLKQSNSWYSFDDDGYRESFLGVSLHCNGGKLGPENKGIYFSPVLVDANHTYDLNSLGYRSPEFKSGQIVAGGCSQTFGVGIKQEMTWPNQLSKSTGIECANISKPGASVQWIVQKIIRYIKEYGNPKAIVCVFPDFYRMDFTVNENLIGFKKKPVNIESKVAGIHLEGMADLDQRPKYSKVPHNVNDVLPVELPFYISFQYIHILEQYCKSNNIKLAWTTWKFNLNELIKKLASEYDIFTNYIEVDDNKWIDTGNNDVFCKFFKDALYHNKDAERVMCHTEIAKEYPHCFEKGADLEASPDWRHMGIHRHIHFYEAFEHFLNEDI